MPSADQKNFRAAFAKIANTHVPQKASVSVAHESTLQANPGKVHIVLNPLSTFPAILY